MIHRSPARRTTLAVTVAATLLAVLPPAVSAEEGPASAAALFKGSSILGSFTEAVVSVRVEAFLQNGSKTRDIEIYQSFRGGMARTLAQVTAPSFLRNMKLLRIEGPSGAESLLKTSQGVKRLSEGSGEERLFDTDLSPADLDLGIGEGETAAFEPGEPQGATEGSRAVAISSNRAGRYAKRVVVVAPDRVVERIDYYDAKGALRKRYSLLESESAGGRRLPKRARIEDLARSSRTEIAYLSFRIDEPIPDRIFNKGNL